MLDLDRQPDVESCRSPPCRRWHRRETRGPGVRPDQNRARSDRPAPKTGELGASKPLRVLAESPDQAQSSGRTANLAGQLENAGRGEGVNGRQGSSRGLEEGSGDLRRGLSVLARAARLSAGRRLRAGGRGLATQWRRSPPPRLRPFTLGR